MSPKAHFLLVVTNFFKISHLYFLSSNITFVPLYFFYIFFQSFFSFFSLSFPPNDFSLHISLAHFCHTQLLQWPFPIGHFSTPSPSLFPCSSRFIILLCLTQTQTQTLAGSDGAAQAGCTSTAHRCGSGSQTDLPKCRTGMATPGSGLWCLRRGRGWSCGVL